MKTLSGRQQAAVLWALVRNWRNAIRKWKCARIVLGAKRHCTDARIRTAMHWLCVFDGNWNLAKSELRSPDMLKLVAWVDSRLHGKGGAV